MRWKCLILLTNYYIQKIMSDIPFDKHSAEHMFTDQVEYQVTVSMTQVWEQRDNPIYADVSKVIQGITDSEKALELLRELFFQKYDFNKDDVIITKTNIINRYYGDIIEIQVLSWQPKNKENG